MDTRKLASVLILLALGFCLPILALDGQSNKRGWQSTDAFRIKAVHDLQLSPDGESLLFVLNEKDLEGNRNRSSLWALPTRGGEARPLTEEKGSVQSPRWSPDSKRIAYFSRTGGGLGLWVMDRSGAGKRKVADLERSNVYSGLRGNELCWSPDGKELAYTAAGPSHYPIAVAPPELPSGNEVMIIDRLLFKAYYYFSDLRRTRVLIAGVDGRGSRQISSGDHDFHSISWSPDGKSIACIANLTGRDDFNANNDIVLLSPEGDAMVRLVQTPGPEYVPSFSPDGAKLAYFGRLRENRSKESDAEFYKLYIAPSGGGEPFRAAASLDRWLNSFAWSPDGRKIHVTAQDSGRVCLYEVSSETGAVVPIVEDKGQVASFAAGRDGEIFYVFSDFLRADEIWRIKGGDKVRLTDLNARLAGEIEIAESERFVFPSFDGLEIEGWLMRPHGFEAGRMYPMVLAVHGGPHAQYGYSLQRTALYQLLSAQGYAVAFMNPRGSSGYSQAFSDMCVGDLGGSDYRDLMAGLDFMLDRYGFIDPDRLGVTGVSYGGYMTNWIITHSDRFKAAVSVSSISNLISHWGTNCNYDWFESDMGFIPFDDYDRAWAASPLKYVKSCRTPTLFINGACDFGTHVSQAEEMFTALKKLGVDAVMAVYPDDGHGVNNQPRHTHDYHRRALAWFDKHQKEGEAIE